ncbi:hypothetical protein D3C77_635000 [compost metagenome]
MVPLVTKFFTPFTSQPPSTRVARVFISYMLIRPGSLPTAEKMLHFSNAGLRNSSCCSGVPTASSCQSAWLCSWKQWPVELSARQRVRSMLRNSSGCLPYRLPSGPPKA